MRHGISVTILCCFLGAVGFAALWVLLIEYQEWRERCAVRRLTREYVQWERARHITGGNR